VRHSGGVSTSGWRRTSQGALMGCSGAGGARDCGCGAAEVWLTAVSRDGGGGLAAVPSGEEEEGLNAGA
jgi:hypothetical protein